MSKCKQKPNDVFSKTWNPNSEPWITELEALMEGLAVRRGFIRAKQMVYLDEKGS